MSLHARLTHSGASTVKNKHEYLLHSISPCCLKNLLIYWCGPYFKTTSFYQHLQQVHPKQSPLHIQLPPYVTIRLSEDKCAQRTRSCVCVFVCLCVSDSWVCHPPEGMESASCLRCDAQNQWTGGLSAELIFMAMQGLNQRQRITTGTATQTLEIQSQLGTNSLYYRVLISWDLQLIRHLLLKSFRFWESEESHFQRTHVNRPHTPQKKPNCDVRLHHSPE